MSCADVQTIQAGNGSKTQFSFDFPYLFKSEIQVSFWNATTKEWDVIAQGDATYPWQITDANPTIVEFTSTAPPAPTVPVDPNETSVDNVRIRRTTSIDDIRALFNPGSAIRSDDLNKNFEQLRYAIQEANCQGVTDDVYQYLLDNYWDRFDNTLYSADAWRSDDATIATTAALDQRFQDEVNDTFTKAELAAASNIMPDNDDAVPTTGAINDYIDEVITNDIGTDGTGITVTDDGDGTITLGLAANSIDFDRLKDADIITSAEQDAGSPAPADNNIFTASAAARRFDTIVQSGTPSGSDWEVGKTWLQTDQDLTLSIWNGSAWTGIASGGTFTNQPKVVYVDASSGDDSNDGHRISRPKKTIKAAVNQINSDSTYGDGSVVVVAPGTYQEVAPIDIQKANVSIIGTALRSCIIHPTPATETNSLFRVNSGSYLQNLTFTGMKASGATGNAVDPELPVNQGWNVSFYPNATIIKSPYIQNCTNFSDSEIDNSNLNVITPAGGAAGDTDSAPTGGGLLVDGSVVNSSSPLRSMVCDSYTHVGLNGPGILVTNNGYAQCTSSYAFFNTYHIKCLNGGQANLAASTTDFGDRALVADGKSTVAIFTADLTTAAADGDITFTIDAPVADVSWHGTATRPQGNMLVTLNGVTYPILSATANGSGWDVTISRPDPTNRSTNLGLDGAVSTPAVASFYLRSMIASSGHTMEYVGSGTDYTALPENGGVPDDTKQIVESNNGKVWTAITDQNGKFKIGDFFEVDQQLGFVTIPEGSIAFDLLSDQSPELATDLDANSNKITSLADPTSAQDAATKKYVDDQDATKLSLSGGTMTGDITFNGSQTFPGVLPLTGGTMTGNITFNAGQTIDGYTPRTSTTGSAEIPSGTTAERDGTPSAGYLRFNTTDSSFEGYDGTAWGAIVTGSINLDIISEGNSSAEVIDTGSDGRFVVTTEGSERLRIDSSGRLGLGTSSPAVLLHVDAGSSDNFTYLQARGANALESSILFLTKNSSGVNRGGSIGHDGNTQTLYLTGDTSGGSTQHVSITSGGLVGIGTQTPNNALEVNGSFRTYSAANGDVSITHSGLVSTLQAAGSIALAFGSNNAERARIDTSGRLLVGTSTSASAGNASVARIQIVGNSTDAAASSVLALNRGEAATSITSGEAIGNITFGDSSGNEFGLIQCIADANAGSGDYPGRLVLSTTADGASSPTERMRIQADGRVVLFNTDLLYPNTDNAVGLGANNHRYSAVWAANGTIQTSDERAKVDIADAQLGSNFIKSLRPVSYRWIEGGKRDTGERDEDGNYIYESVPGIRTHWGFIAQEVKQVVDAAGVDFGGWVLTDKDDPDSQQALRYDQFIAPLTKALQETMAELEALKAEVAALKGA